MPLSERARRYLHFEMPEEAIFNVDRWDFDPVQEVRRSVAEDAALRVALRTRSGRRAELSVTAWAPGVVRFRFGPVEKHWPESSEMLVQTRPSPGPDVRISEETHELETESLRVRITENPWGIEVRDRTGRLLQRSHVSGPLKIHFPLHQLGFQQRKSDGLQRVFAVFDLWPDEALFGLGEKFGPLNKRGQRVVSWDTDTTNCSTDRTYKNVPLLLSSRGYGLFLHDSHRIEYELGSWSFTATAFAVENDGLEWFFLYGPAFKTILRRYVDLTGHVPVPPLWTFGLWMSRFGYKNRAELEKIAAELRARRIPADVLHLDPFWLKPGHACDLEWDERAFPNPDEMLRELAEQGFKVCLWEQPYVPAGTEMFREGDEKGYFAKDEQGRTLLIPDFEEKDTGIVDFTNPEAVRWYQEKHRRLLQRGAAVFKTDMGEAVPREAVFADGRTGAELHNLYPLLYNRTVWEAVAERWNGRGVVWGRSGYAGSQRYPVQWGGDSFTTFEEMAAVLRGGLSYGLSGVPFWSQDIGGFQGNKPDPELYIRWAQWGLFNSHSRCHGVQPREPWEYGEEAERIFRKFDELRYRLLPTLWAAAYEASELGLPIMRPLVLEFQDDPTTWHIETEYLFGPWILVVPVLERGGHVRFYLPRGRWLDFWTGKLLKGPSWHERQVPLEEMPLFLRDGALLPKAPLAQFVGEKRWEPLELELFVTSESSWTLRDEEGQPQRVSVHVQDGRAEIHWEPRPPAVELLWRGPVELRHVSLNGEEIAVQEDTLPSGERVFRAEVSSGESES